MSETALNLASQVVRTREVLSASLGDELVMMSIEKGSYYGLDPVGTHVCGRLGEPSVVDALCNELVLNFEVDLDDCREDVLAFLGQLLEQGLIEVVPASEAPQQTSP